LTNTPTNTPTPAPATCLSPGDEVLLIRLARGGGPTADNSGSYEFLRVNSVNNNTVTFTTQKTKWYGNGWRSDSNIGIGSGQIRVMLIRVPNYENVTINGNGKIIASPYDGYKYGVVAFRVSGTLTGDSSSAQISASGLGYRGGIAGSTSSYGESTAGYIANAGGGKAAGTVWQCPGATGGGGGYGSNGGVGGSDSAGGTAYGNSQLSSL